MAVTVDQAGDPGKLLFPPQARLPIISILTRSKKGEPAKICGVFGDDSRHFAFLRNLLENEDKVVLGVTYNTATGKLSLYPLARETDSSQEWSDYLSSL
jgi:hypothetical protein